ncbi:hypothetical protein GTP41_17865 [Pseudoduganella sp. DS3]|uniref:GNAT family N-acetyltransferase n=1 Tax=Pseudoduganella guangdongensis TaxID=2692179 RepID=A0A6N9HL95_9BURK|nr:hypothetical protein [Pseudoduganella guangdongensis]MYN03963.1 hypothetical protein [Pseudoduganella guangdongensis]
MLTRYIRSFAELGAANAAWYLLARCLQLVGCRMQRYLFVAQRVAQQAMRPGAGSIVVRGLMQLDQFPPAYPRPLHVVAARFRQGGCSIAAWKGADLAGILWFQMGAYQEDEVRARYCLPSPASCWDYDVFVQPDLRLGTAFCRLWDEAHQRMRARGFQWTCSRISAFNPASLRAHRRIGTVMLGSANFFIIGRWQLMLASRPPYVHLSGGAMSCPKLVFDTATLK